MAAHWSNELQESAGVSQAAAALLARQTLGTGELRQLRRELEQLAQGARQRLRELKQQGERHAGAQQAQQALQLAHADGRSGKRARRTSDGAQSDTMGPPATPARARHSSGTPVQDDFSRVRVTNQVHIQTFWASLDAYFRPLVDDDLALLDLPRVDALDVPALGRFYAHRWAEEEVAHYPELAQSARTRHVTRALLADAAPLKHARPLTDRVLAALVAERIVDAPDASADAEHDAAPPPPPPSEDAAALEDRLARELRYIGILDDHDVDWADRQDDEVSAALRHLQRQLRVQTEINKQRCARLLPVAREHLGQQEYVQVIDELDKQV
ncbi:Transcriptional regulator, partial [Coemansia sp. RSA 2603]